MSWLASGQLPSHREMASGSSLVDAPAETDLDADADPLALSAGPGARLTHRRCSRADFGFAGSCGPGTSAANPAASSTGPCSDRHSSLPQATPPARDANRLRLVRATVLRGSAIPAQSASTFPQVRGPCIASTEQFDLG